MGEPPWNSWGFKVSQCCIDFSTNGKWGLMHQKWKNDHFTRNSHGGFQSYLGYKSSKSLDHCSIETHGFLDPCQKPANGI